MNKIKETLNAENVYGIGDTHSLTFDGIMGHYEIENFILIHVGDCGMGFEFPSRDLDALSELNDYCEAHNGILIMIRGNHDRPQCWENTYFTEVFDRIKFAKDYDRYLINGKNVLFVGGAVSIDRTLRVPEISWFGGEEFWLADDYKYLDPCDVLVTHTRGKHQPPYEKYANQRIIQRDHTLLDDLDEEAILVEKLYNQVKPKLHIWGHFHETTDMVVDDSRWRCLDINEVWDMTPMFNE